MTDTSLGFRYRGRKSGGNPTIQKIPASATATLTRGDMVTLSSNKAALSATGDTAFLGMVQKTAAYTATTDLVPVIVDSDAIYGVYDNNARNKGDTLDLSGTTGAQTVAASSNKEFVVWATKLNSSDETLVCFNTGVHEDNLKR